MQKALKKYFPVFIFLTLAAFLVSFLLPFIMGAYLSFTEFKVVNESKWVGISNYIKIFTSDKTFMNALWLTVKFTAVSIVTINIIAFTVAMLLTKSLKGTNFFRTVFFMPNLIGGIVLGHIWSLIINGVLGFFGVDITYNPEYGFWGLVILMNWQLIGYMMIIYIAGLQSVPGDMLEAAKIDGANPVQTFKNVTVPLLSPTIFFVVIITAISSFQVFDLIYLMTQGGPLDSTNVLVYAIYKNAFEYFNVGKASAIAYVLFTIILVLTLIQWNLRKKLVYNEN
jgi:raffinose/stachyose/melibiose transport system permease protein